MRKSFIAGLAALGLAAAGAAIWFITKPATQGEDGRGKAAAKAMQVRTATAAVSAVPVVLDAVGAVEADQSVAVRAEVNGVLQKIDFREGEMVRAGQVLFQIDASLPQAEVDKARANLARSQAEADEARAQARRLEPLLAKEYVTRQEYAQALAQEQAAAASVQADQAALKSAQAQLGYTRITAPISGRAGILNIKPGNLVSAASALPLVVINATRPVMVAFSVPQQQLQNIRERQRERRLEVEIRRDAGGEVLTRGELAFIDNAVDAQTGTIRMKARLPNRDETVWPGELVLLRLILDVQQDALVVPEAAIQLGQNGSFVYTLVDGKAQVQPVKVARQMGGQVVVAEGLQAGQQVIVSPPNNLRPDSPVEAAAPQGEAGAQGDGKRGANGSPVAGGSLP